MRNLSTTFKIKKIHFLKETKDEKTNDQTYINANLHNLINIFS